MSHNTVRALFEARLEQWAKTKGLHVQYENDSTYDPADGDTYLEAFTLPALTGSETLDGIHREYRGIFQVNVVTAAGTGAAAGRALGEELAALYPLNDRLSKGSFTVQIIEPMAQARGISEPTTYTIPVSLTYRADTI